MSHRKPFDQLEDAAIRLALDAPDSLHSSAVDALRYVIRFAKLQRVRREDGVDLDVTEALAPHAWKIRHVLTPALIEERSLWAAMRAAPDLLAITRERRRRLLEQFPLDRDSLEAEVCQRPLVVTCGGGGGAGYGYAGAWTLLHRKGLQPALLSGTSIGALMAMFRARRLVFDGAPMVAAARRLSWDKVFRVLQSENRYGLPATLRLYLRAALGPLFLTQDGRAMTFDDLEIPLLVVATGIGVDALKHDLSFYEHFLDDAVAPGVPFRPTRIAKVTQLASIMRELLATPDALREVVFGADPATHNADVLDAAGFSASIPGLIHYDVLRDDRRMKLLLDELYGRYGITRLVEGGILNNVPVRPAFAEVIGGRITRRDAYFLALDCFSPKIRQFMFLPIQQLVRPNVTANIAYANQYHALDKTLSPLNLVPEVHDVTRAMDWTIGELEAHMPVIQRHCTPLTPI